MLCIYSTCKPEKQIRFVKFAFRYIILRVLSRAASGRGEVDWFKNCKDVYNIQMPVKTILWRKAYRRRKRLEKKKKKVRA